MNRLTIKMKYIKYNSNPGKRKSGDCVVRAIAKATGKEWLDTFDGLVKISRKHYTMPSEKFTFTAYLKQEGFTMCRMPKHADNRRYTVEQFADENPQGIYIISVCKHLTVLIDGTLYDTWDCSRKAVGNYWTAE